MVNNIETQVRPELQPEKSTPAENLFRQFIKNKKSGIIFLVVFVLLACVYRFILPDLIKPDMVNQLIKSSVNDGYSLDIKNLKTDLGWDLSLILNADEVSLSQEKKNLLYSGKTHVKIPLVMLLFKKFDNSQFYSNSLQAHLERDAKGDLNIKKAFKFKKSATRFSSFRLAVKDYYITFADNKSKPIILDGYDLDLGNIRLYRLKTFGSIVFPDNTRTILNVNFLSRKPLKKGDFVLKGNVDNLDLKKIEKYLKEFCPVLTKAEGMINGDFDIDSYGREKLTNNLKVSLNTNNVYLCTKKYPHYFEIADDAQILANGKYYHHKLDFKNFRIISRDYNLEVIGQIKNTNKKNKNLNIKIKSKKSDIRKVLGLVSKDTEILHDSVNKAIKYNVNGVINCNLKVKGCTNAPKYWGNINIRGLTSAGNPVNPKTIVNLSYKRRKLTLNSVLFDSKDGIVRISGTSIMGRTPKLNFKTSSDKFLLGEFHKSFIATADMLGLSTGILPEMSFEGDGKMAITVKGRGKNVSVDGHLWSYNTKVVHRRFAKPAYVKFADLQFKKRKILFENIENYVDSYKSYLNGYISLDNDVEMTLNSPGFSLPLGVFIIRNSSLFEQSSKGLNYLESSDGKINLKVRFLADKFHPLKASGTIRLLENNLMFKGFSFPASNVIGEIIFDGNDYRMQNMAANSLGSPVTMNGEISNEKINAQIITPSVDIAKTANAILTSKSLNKIAPFLVNIKNPSGRVYSVLTLKGKIDENLFDKIECTKLNSKCYMGNSIAPIIVNNGSFTSDKNEFCINKFAFSMLNAKGVVEGKVRNISQKPDYDLKVNFHNIDRSVFEALKTSKMNPKLGELFNSIDDFSGNASGSISIKKDISGKISFHNFGFRYLPVSLPVKIKDGEISIKGSKIVLPNSQVQLAGSIFKMNASYERSKKLNLDLTGNLSPYDIDKYLNKSLVSPLNLKQTAPMRLNIIGDKNGLTVNAGIILRPDNSISYKGIAAGDSSNSYLVGGGVTLNGPIMKFDNMGVQQFANPYFASLDLNNILGAKNLLELSGWVNQNNSDGNLRVYARDFMDINLLNEFLSKKFPEKIFYGGSFKGNLLLKGKMDAPKIIGDLEFRGAKIPAFKTVISTLKVIFTNDNIYFKDGAIKLADSELHFEGVAENVIELPYVFKDMVITSDNINTDEIIKIFRNESSRFSKIPLISVRKGSVAAKKLIINNLITDDAAVEFSFTPDWLLSLDKFSFNTAGGLVIGHSTFNLLSYKSHTHMKFQNLKANAVATTLLQMPNEIYGLLNGEANFSTKGLEREELIRNSNGNVRFQITSGRLVRMGSFEYLLMAAEVLKSGITGLSINNVCTLLSPHKTGNFDTITVNFKVKNGVLFTDDLVSRGKNLSIYLAGSFDMISNYADFTILGRVSKSMINILGPVGNLSINKVLNTISKVDDGANIMGRIAKLEKIPGIDFNDKDYRRFIVNMEGDLYDPKSVKNFRWID